MATKKKMLQAAAGQAGGEPGLDIDEVFSTYLYTGTGSAQTITNGIDLDGEGGLVWQKLRDTSENHRILDTETGEGKYLITNSSAAQGVDSGNGTFNANGFSISGNNWNTNGANYVSWTWRKAPKFFTCLTYTGTGSAQNISHDLGSDVGFLLIKKTDSAGNWRCWHRGLPGTGSNMEFNQTGAYETATTIFNGTDPTSTQFSVGTNSNVNASGGTYVAYLFAHNDGDGGFGPDGDQDIIKCGNYAGNGSDARTIDLGFEAQWVLLKRSDGSTDWFILDNMRGLPVRSASSQYLEANTTNAEAATGQVFGDNQGFMVDAGDYNSSGENYIYMAIRRGPLAPPESATEVFAIDTLGGTSPNPPGWNAGFPVDFAIRGNTASFAGVAEARLLGTKYLNTNGTNSENTSTLTTWDYMDGFFNSTSVSSNYYSWMWKRAPGFFDAVAYTGDGVAGRTVSHNLGVAPEMMWVKGRDVVDHWHVYHAATTADNYMILNGTNAETDSVTVWNDTDPTSSVFTVGNNGGVNGSGSTYIAYLFASTPGVSKVGSYTGNGSSQTIDCGFTSGARFVLIKAASTTGDWQVFDTTRGIVAGGDSRLELNTTAAQDQPDDIDPASSGFALTIRDEVNKNGETFIFYAIA